MKNKLRSPVLNGNRGFPCSSLLKAGTFLSAAIFAVGVLIHPVSFAAPVKSTNLETQSATSAPDEPPPPTKLPRKKGIQKGDAAYHSSVSENNRDSNSESSDDGFLNERTWYLFGGIDLGTASYGAFNSVTEGSRSGFQGGVRGLLAHYSKRWLVDGGIGWQIILNSGKNPDGSTNKVTTRTGYLDLSPRYRFNQNWQLGPEMELYLSGDNGLNTNALSSSGNNGLFIGLQGMYEWMSDATKFRLGARWLLAANATGRSVNVLQAFFQFGFGVFGSDQEPDERPRRYNTEQVNQSDLERGDAYAAPADPLPLATPEPANEQANVIPTPAPQAVKKLVMTLDVTQVPFEFNSARLPKYNMDRIREIGRFLGEHQNNWKELIVEGHTDERGASAYNNHLSKARADTVRQLLGEGGAPIKRIKSMGFGKRKPLDKHHNEKAWAKNRRVELDFRGVKDVMMLKDGLGQ